MKIKKLLCLLTTAIITTSAFTSVMPATAYYFYDSVTLITEYGDFTYTLKQDVQYGSVKIPYSATVTDIPNIKKVEIPEKVTYKGIEFTVTDIKLDDSDYEYKKHNKIEEIILPKNVYNISSFSGFPILRRINIPKNTMIGREKTDDYSDFEVSYKDEDFDAIYDSSLFFLYCLKLKLSVDPDNPYYSYKNDMLLSKDCKEVILSFNDGTDITIPNGVQQIRGWGRKAFGTGFPNAKKVTLPETLKYIGMRVFADTNITKITLPDKLEKIGHQAFKGTKLNKIIIPDSVKKIENSSFAYSTIKSVKFGKNLTTIGIKAFKRCNNLKSVTIPKGLKKLDSWAFKACKKLESVKISSNDIKFGIRVFEKCPKLKKVSINKAKTISYHEFSRCSSLKTVDIKETEKIERGAFYKCKNLSKIKIGNKKKAPKIEKRAFKNTKKGIKFYVENKKVAKSLKKQLKGSGVKNAGILVGKKVIYKNVK